MMATPTRPRSSCEPAELERIVIQSGGGVCLMPSRPFDEVYPNIYIGERGFAMNKMKLESAGVTHILNTAQGVKGVKKFGYVETDQEYYQDTGITFCGIKATDTSKFNISPFLRSASDFIDNALQSQGNKVLVHCVEGFSRSPTVVIAYLMIKKNLDVRDALKTVLSRREVCPNDGFKRQLCELNEQLIKHE